MYFLINDDRARAYTTLGDACRTYCEEMSQAIAPGDNPVKVARNINGGEIPAVSLSLVFEDLAKMDKPNTLCASLSRAVDDLYK